MTDEYECDGTTDGKHKRCDESGASNENWCSFCLLRHMCRATKDRDLLIKRNGLLKGELKSAKYDIGSLETERDQLLKDKEEWQKGTASAQEINVSCNAKIQEDSVTVGRLGDELAAVHRQRDQMQAAYDKLRDAAQDVVRMAQKPAPHDPEGPKSKEDNRCT